MQQERYRNFTKDERLRILCRRHGITVDHYWDMWDAQFGKCAICRTPLAGKKICIDHDHNDQFVRGLLCNTCNTGLGKFGDDVYLVQRALDYLIENGV